MVLKSQFLRALDAGCPVPGAATCLLKSEDIRVPDNLISAVALPGEQPVPAQVTSVWFLERYMRIREWETDRTGKKENQPGQETGVWFVKPLIGRTDYYSVSRVDD